MKTCYSSDEIEHVFNFELLRDLSGSANKFSLVGFYLHFLPLIIKTLVKYYMFSFGEGMTADESIDYLQRFIVHRCIDAHIDEHTLDMAMVGHSDPMVAVFNAIYGEDSTYEIGHILRAVGKTIFNGDTYQAELWIEKHCDNANVKATLLAALHPDFSEEEYISNIDPEIFNMIPIGYRMYA